MLGTAIWYGFTTHIEQLMCIINWQKQQKKNNNSNVFAANVTITNRLERGESAKAIGENVPEMALYDCAGKTLWNETMCGVQFILKTENLFEITPQN